MTNSNHSSPPQYDNLSVNLQMQFPEHNIIISEALHAHPIQEEFLNQITEHPVFLDHAEEGSEEYEQLLNQYKPIINNMLDPDHTIPTENLPIISQWWRHLEEEDKRRAIIAFKNYSDSQRDILTSNRLRRSTGPRRGPATRPAGSGNKKTKYASRKQKTKKRQGKSNKNKKKHQKRKKQNTRRTTKHRRRNKHRR